MKKTLWLSLLILSLLITTWCQDKETTKTIEEQNTIINSNNSIELTEKSWDQNNIAHQPVDYKLEKLSLDEIFINTQAQKNKIDEWEMISKVPLDDKSKKKLEWTCFDIRDKTENNKIIYLNIHDCVDDYIWWFGNVLFDNWKEYITIYEGQDVIPCETIKKYSIPKWFQGTEGDYCELLY